MFCSANEIDKLFTDVLQFRNFPCAQSTLSFSPVLLQLSLSEGFNLETQYSRRPALGDMNLHALCNVTSNNSPVEGNSSQYCSTVKPDLVAKIRGCRGMGSNITFIALCIPALPLVC